MLNRKKIIKGEKTLQLLFNNLNSTDDIKVYSFVGPSGTGKKL